MNVQLFHTVQCLPYPMCHVSCVTCHVSNVTCHKEKEKNNKIDKVVELVGQGSAINGAYPV